MINIQFEIDPNIGKPSNEISTEIISSVLIEEGKSLAEILVIFTSDEILSDLKKEFFNKEHLTDVIAFRMNDYEEEKVGPAVAGRLVGRPFTLANEMSLTIQDGRSLGVRKP